MQFTKKNLYRKVNTKARGVSHNFGGDYKNTRNKKRETTENIKGSMHGKKQRGLDYTPLFKFLLKNVNGKWDDIYSEAISRLDKSEPIFFLVSLNECNKQNYVRVGESSYFSGMFVDNEGILKLSNPNLVSEDIGLLCNCCTHTLNGEIFN